MELKDGAFVALALSLVLALLAYFTGGFLFYAALALAILFIAGDCLWLKLGAGSLKRHLSLSTRLSRNDVYPGTGVSCTVKASYKGWPGGWPGLSLTLLALMDDSIASKPPDKKMGLRPGEECTLAMEVVPERCGSFDLGHAKVAVSSLLFRDSFLAGHDSPLKVRLSIGKPRLRPGVAYSPYHRHSRIYDSVTEKRSGSDFSGVREYTAGESIKHIDWALSARAGELIVREYEAERALPAYVLIDTCDPPLANGRGGIDFSTGVALAFIERQLVDGDKLGLICFSRAGVIYHVKPGMGREHMNKLADVLSKVRPAEEENTLGYGPSVSLRELYDIGHVFGGDTKALTPFIEETIKEYMANVRDDGLMQAILTVARELKSPCQIKVVTGLSMGMPGLMSGVRLAKYYGHTVTVILNYPAEGQNNERSMELKAAISKLRAQSVNVIAPGRADTPESIFFEGRINSGRGSIRG